MKAIRFVPFILMIPLLFFSSCKDPVEELIKGCTDPISINYNELAEDDDGSCQYEGSVTFWFAESVAQFLVNNNVLNLYFYIDGNLIGSSSSAVYFTSVPSCGASGATSATLGLGSNTSKSVIFKVEEGTGIILWTKTITLNADWDCLLFEMVL